MKRTPKAVQRFMDEYEQTEDEVAAYVATQDKFFKEVPAPGTSFEGWLAFKLGCNLRDAGTVIRWAAKRSPRGA